MVVESQCTHTGYALAMNSWVVQERNLIANHFHRWGDKSFFHHIYKGEAARDEYWVVAHYERLGSAGEPGVESSSSIFPGNRNGIVWLVEI